VRAVLLSLTLLALAPDVRAQKRQRYSREERYKYLVAKAAVVMHTSLDHAKVSRLLHQAARLKATAAVYCDLGDVHLRWALRAVHAAKRRSERQVGQQLTLAGGHYKRCHELAKKLPRTSRIHRRVARGQRDIERLRRSYPAPR
jgi:hypothetical protein